MKFLSRLDLTFYIPMTALAMVTALYVGILIAYLDSEVIIKKQNQAILAGIITNTATKAAYARLEKACGEIVYEHQARD